MAVAGNCTGAGTAVESCSVHSSQALSDPRTPKGFWCAFAPVRSNIFWKSEEVSLFQDQVGHVFLLP